jgi:hypothetical protein
MFGVIQEQLRSVCMLQQALLPWLSDLNLGSRPRATREEKGKGKIASSHHRSGGSASELQGDGSSSGLQGAGPSSGLQGAGSSSGLQADGNSMQIKGGSVLGTSSLCVACFDPVSTVKPKPGAAASSKLYGCQFDCSHVYCEECLRHWVDSSLKDRSLIPLKCGNCGDCVNTTSRAFTEIVGQAALDKLRMCEVVAAMKDPVYCPNKRCLVRNLREFPVGDFWPCTWIVCQIFLIKSSEFSMFLRDRFSKRESGPVTGTILIA